MKSFLYLNRPFLLPMILLLILLACPLAVHALTAEQWIARVDKNMSFTSAEFMFKMTIHLPPRRGGDAKERFFKLKGTVVGEKYALMEYVEPLRNKGTKYLKREDNLWIYFPRQDRTLHLTGHMLREGVQGGDMTFEDMTESEKLLDQYSASISGETDSTVTILMESKDMTVSYPFRETTIDKTTGVPIKSVLSGVDKTPIKEAVVLETKEFKGRMFPVVSEYRSLLIKGRWTRFEMLDIKFDVPWNESTFSKQALEKN